jgi:hypothetical protein
MHKFDPGPKKICIQMVHAVELMRQLPSMKSEKQLEKSIDIQKH